MAGRMGVGRPGTEGRLRGKTHAAAPRSPPTDKAVGSIIYIMRITDGRVRRPLPGPGSQKTPQRIEKARSGLETDAPAPVAFGRMRRIVRTGFRLLAETGERR